MALVTVTDFIREILSYQKLNGRFNVLKNFINEQCVHQDETAKDIVGNNIIRRDANGRAKVAAPVEADDIARKAEVDELKDDIEDGTVVAAFITPSDAVVLASLTENTATSTTRELLKSFRLKYPGEYTMIFDARSSTDSNFAVTEMRICKSTQTTWKTNFPTYRTHSISIFVPVYNGLIDILGYNEGSGKCYIKNVKICGTLSHIVEEPAVLTE